jgi:tricarballylate dehydrogenase
MPVPSAQYDVLVIGGGNAALCAALEAFQLGARVGLLERAPKALRGGNTRHTRNIRHVHAGSDRVVTGAYSEDELWRDLVHVSGQDLNDELARLMIARSAECPAFMERHGVRWQPPLRGTLHLARTNRFFLGGGKALVNAYYQTTADHGVDLRYDTRVVELCMEGDRCTGVLADVNGETERFDAKAVVVASGGFEANIDWLADYWGDAARNFIIRGGPFNDGTVLRALLRNGARPIGNPKGFHAVSVDARSPQFDGGIVTRIDSVPFGIVVNQKGRRFADEGEDLWPRRYASWGGLIAEQPGQAAYSIFDSQQHGKFIPGVYPPITAATVPELSARLGIDASAVEQTVCEFNAAISPDGPVDYSLLDGRTTTGLHPRKSNWAQRIDKAPFYAYPLRPGITFTYLGVAVDREARIATTDGEGFKNIFAAGEVMAGNVLTKGYLAGIGLTIGTVFGRIAGESAAKFAAA